MTIAPTAKRLRLVPRLSGLGVLAVLALAGMHLPLLAQRLRDASIAEPGVLLRWLMVPVLAGGFAILRHRGLSLVRGRGALVLWLLVLLLHAAPATTTDGAHELLLVTPVAAGALGAVGLLLAAARPVRIPRRSPSPIVAPRHVARVFALPASPVFSPHGFAPRPPPYSSAPRFA